MHFNMLVTFCITYPENLGFIGTSGGYKSDLTCHGLSLLTVEWLNSSCESEY